jgi:hypothetical protein
MRRANALMELWPWAGLVGAGLAWALDHQIGSDGTFFDCNAGSTATIVVGILTLILDVACGFASWRLWQSGKETAARRFIALLGVLFALLLGLAILLSTVAGLILPECLT